MDAPVFAPWSPVFTADPYPAYAALRDRGRVHWFEPTGQWLVPHHADVSALLRDRRLGRTYLHRFTHEEFGRTPPPPGHEPFQMPDFWKRFRGDEKEWGFLPPHVRVLELTHYVESLQEK